MVATSEPVYQHSHPRRLTPEMRRYLDGKGSTTETDAKAWRRADGTVHEVTGASSVRIFPGHGLSAVRFDLYRALHVDPAGE